MIYIKKIVKKYFSAFVYFYRYLRYRLFVVVGLSILIGVLDGLGLSMFLPLIQMADGNELASGVGLGKLAFIIDGFTNLGVIFNLKVALLILFVFFALKGLVTYVAQSYKVRVNQFFISSLRHRLTRLFTSYSYGAFVAANIGKIQNSFTGEIQKVTNAYAFYSNCIQQLLLTFVYLIFVFTVDWRFALLVCVGGGISNLLYSSVYRKTKQQSHALTKNNSDYQGLIIQYVANFKYLKATGYLNRYADKLRESINNIESNNKKIGILNARIIASREPMLIGVVCIVIFVHVYFLEGKLAAIMVSLLFFHRALTALLSFQSSYNSFLGVSGSLESIEKFEIELRDGLEKEGAEILSEIAQGIQVCNVDFKYNTTFGLKNISFEIAKNQTVAFVGESGSGKTTLINLISGLLLPTNGTIYIDNIPIEQLSLLSYQSRIGYITQEPVIFNDTIFANVTFWAEPTEENKLRFQKAIRQALLEDYLTSLPQKEYTILGNQGVNLSGGQRQRISIARELFKNIDMLILDEATSALDSETEKEIQKNIDALQGQYTLLIIAHRLSTIKNADKIILLEKGQIQAEGQFEELIQTSERFKKMVALQEI